MNRLLIGVAAATLAVAIGPASAQSAPPPGVAQGTAPIAAPVQRPHAMMMAGKVMTRADVSAHVRRLFARLDTNHDGYLTREEMRTLGTSMGSMHGTGGMHGQGAHGERMTMPDRAAMFDRLDANHDGMINRQEYMAAKPEIRERRMVMMHDRDSDRGMAMHGMNMGGFAGHLFTMADANHDGRVSLAEAEAAALAHFDRADRNHDGRITPDERQQMHAEMRARHGG